MVSDDEEKERLVLRSVVYVSSAKSLELGFSFVAELTFQ